jgi:hypothetical protein
VLEHPRPLTPEEIRFWKKRQKISKVKAWISADVAGKLENDVVVDLFMRMLALEELFNLT